MSRLLSCLLAAPGHCPSRLPLSPVLSGCLRPGSGLPGPAFGACQRPATWHLVLSPAPTAATAVTAGEAVTFFTEEDAGQLRSIANVMRAAGCEVPAWMLELKKERRHRKRSAAPDAGGISTEPKAERQKGGKGSSLGTNKGQQKQQRRQNGSGKQQQQQVKSTKQQPKQKLRQQEQRPPKKKSRAAAAE